MSSTSHKRPSSRVSKTAASTVNVVPIPSRKKMHQILDADGNDITPLPMIPRPQAKVVNDNVKSSTRSLTGSKANIKASKTNLGDSSAKMVQSASDVLGGMNTQGQQGVPFGVTQSAKASVTDFLNHLENSVGQSSQTNFGRSFNFSRFGTDANEDIEVDTSEKMDEILSSLPPREPVVPNPKQHVHVILSETDYNVAFDMPSLYTSTTSPEFTQVSQQNAAYTARPLDTKPSTAMQTISTFSKHKDNQAGGNAGSSIGVQVNTWAIHDAYIEAGMTEADIEKAEKIEQVETENLQTEIADAAAESIAALGVSLPAGSLSMSSVAMSQTKSQLFPPSVNQSMVSITSADVSRRTSISVSTDPSVPLPPRFNLELLKESLRTVERSVLSNTYYKQICEYRDVPIALDDGDDEKQAQRRDNSVFPSLQVLWTFRCDLTRMRTVNAMAWNKKNDDMLIVAYGAVNGNQQGLGNLIRTNPKAALTTSPASTNTDGLVLCWSLKNPEYPERIYRCNSPATAIDFSIQQPSLMAVGFADGGISILDVRDEAPTRLLTTDDMIGKHHEAVWELQWLEQEGSGDDHTKSEVLVSISADGRVTQWTPQKNMINTDIMLLRRVSTSTKGENSSSKSANLLSRQSGGMCFDFAPNDKTSYVAGSEEGQIYRCSTAYTEQPIEVYSGHTDAVYKLAWSPFLPSVFLSCSADWTIRLWDTQYSSDSNTKSAQVATHEILKLQSSHDAVLNVQWSPICSTVLGTVSLDGHVEIWDLAHSSLDPLILHSVLDRKLTSLLFARRSPVAVTGDDHGVVSVYRIRKVGFWHSAPSEDLKHEESPNSRKKEVLHKSPVGVNSYDSTVKEKDKMSVEKKDTIPIDGEVRKDNKDEPTNPPSYDYNSLPTSECIDDPLWRQDQSTKLRLLLENHRSL